MSSHSASASELEPWNRYAAPQSLLTPGQQATALTDSTWLEPIIILGAGLAGCWLAQLLAERGVQVIVLEQHATVAGGASGNPAGIVKPYVTRAWCPAMEFHVQAHDRLLHYLKTLPTLSSDVTPMPLLRDIGVLQLVEKDYAKSFHYDSLNAKQAKQVAGVELNCPAIQFNNSGWLNPRLLCQQLIIHRNIQLRCAVSVRSISPQLTQHGKHYWQLQTSDNDILSTHHLVLACGHGLNQFAQTQYLPVVPARGQISRFQLASGSPKPGCVINGKHYIIPDGQTLLIGATFERGNSDARIHVTDHDRNLAGLSALLPDVRVNCNPLAGYAGVRATTPDRLPIAGPVADNTRLDSAYADLRHGKAHKHYPSLPCHEGLYVLGGLGSRGIVTAALIAEHLADLLMGVNTISRNDWNALLNPARFRIRDIKRGVNRDVQFRDKAD